MNKVNFKPRQTTEFIVVHCAATPPDRDVGVAEIRRWHLDKGWLDIGYHYVIRRNGDIELGRLAHVMGAHVGKRIPGRRHLRYNHVSVGVCMAGGVAADVKTPEDNFTAAQWLALRNIIDALLEEHPDAKVVGHRDLDNRKACPSFDVARWFNRKG